MKVKYLNPNNYALIFDQGDDFLSEIESFAKKYKVQGAHFQGIGALNSVTLGYFDWQKKEYKEIPHNEQVEVASLNGNIATKEGEPKVHAHIVVADSEGKAYAGHLIEAKVRPTLEVFLTVTTKLNKIKDEESGLDLLTDL
jgi:uncharacterized protein